MQSIIIYERTEQEQFKNFSSCIHFYQKGDVFKHRKTSSTDSAILDSIPALRGCYQSSPIRYGVSLVDWEPSVGGFPHECWNKVHRIYRDVKCIITKILQKYHSSKIDEWAPQKNSNPAFSFVHKTLNYWPKFLDYTIPIPAHKFAQYHKLQLYSALLRL